jgi:hypothetical protein
MESTSATATEETPIPIGALMSKLKTNTEQRNTANQTNQYLNTRINNLMKTQFETFGRLVKYDPSIFEEVIQYAENNSAMLYIESSTIGMYSVIGDYTTKSGKTFKAHFTANGHYIKKAEKGDAPISYKGYFSYKKFKHLFKINRNNTQYKCFEDFVTPV